VGRTLVVPRSGRVDVLVSELDGVDAVHVLDGAPE
jgi:hypothetical protein